MKHPELASWSLLALLGGLLCALLMWSCEPCKSYDGWYGSITTVDYSHADARETPLGVRYVPMDGVTTADWINRLDTLTAELTVCLAMVNPEWIIRHDCSTVVIHPEWYVSQCTGAQLIPSDMPCELCRKKGIVLRPGCCDDRDVSIGSPVERCLCPCNARAAIQDDGCKQSIVTAPDLRDYKHHLARLITGINNPYADKSVRHCLEGSK